LYDNIKQAATKRLTEKLFNATVGQLNRCIVGSGELKLQQMIFVVAVLDDDLPIGWIRYCNPGSKEYQEPLKERGIGKTNDEGQVSQVTKGQAGQIVKSICTKAKVLAPLAKHMLQRLLG
jgi:hypothetical protein